MIGEWLDIGWVNEIPVRGSRTVQVEGGARRAHVNTNASGFSGEDRIAAKLDGANSFSWVHSLFGVWFLDFFVGLS